MAAGFYHWLEAGKQFKAIKDELGPRQWAPWLREHDISRSTAERLLHIAERFDPICTTVEQIDEFSIDLRALQLLAARTVPLAAAQAAVGVSLTRARPD
jgi:hypothetical protein